MHARITAIAAVGLVSGLAWFWFAREAPKGLPRAEDTTGAGVERHAQQADSKRRPSPQRPALPDPRLGPTAPEPKNARSPSPPHRTEVAGERSQPAARAPVEDAWEPVDGADDREVAEGSEDIARIKQLLAALHDVSRGTSGADPTEPIAAELRPEDVDLLDLDGDREITPWELERVKRLLERAEHHPLRYDLDDGAYPVERHEYGREEWEFDAVDTNEDDLMDADEFHSFLIESERISLLLDADGDRQISRSESGLSEEDFASFDPDDSGALKAWEIRRAVALGAFD
jgi:hypothetical protein